MKRDPRLVGLSSDHHQALVLARALTERRVPFTAEDGEALASRFALELEPHFRVEEDVLLPALEAAGRPELARRTQADHDFLRGRLPLAAAGDGEAARALGERLGEHVRFEERELFPVCEALLPEHVLDEVWRRAPKAPRG